VILDSDYPWTESEGGMKQESTQTDVSDHHQTRHGCEYDKMDSIDDAFVGRNQRLGVGVQFEMSCHVVHEDNL